MFATQLLKNKVSWQKIVLRLFNDPSNRSLFRSTPCIPRTALRRSAEIEQRTYLTFNFVFAIFRVSREKVFLIFAIFDSLLFEPRFSVRSEHCVRCERFTKLLLISVPALRCTVRERFSRLYEINESIDPLFRSFLESYAIHRDLRFFARVVFRKNTLRRIVSLEREMSASFAKFHDTVSFLSLITSNVEISPNSRATIVVNYSRGINVAFDRPRREEHRSRAISAFFAKYSKRYPLDSQDSSRG